MEVPNSPNYKIERILMVESHLTRKPEINFKDGIRNNVKINVKTGNNTKNSNPQFGVGLGIEVSGLQSEKEMFKIIVTIVGIFREEGKSSELTRDSFQQVNAPAILFPFIREHVASLGQKAGLGNIILQPINFLKVNKVRK